MHAISTITSVLDVEAGHLEVDPHQAVVARAQWSSSGTLSRRTLPARGPRVDSAADDRSPRRLASRRRVARASSNVARFMAAEDVATSPTLVARSIDDPEWFWDAVVRFLGMPFYDAVRARARHVATASRGRRGSSAGAATSRSTCVDRYADDPATRDDAAVVWEGEEGDVRDAHVARAARAHRSHRVGARARVACGAGDAVGLFLPMLPETVAALFAVAKLGAIFLPIFSGYGADAVAVRLDDAGAVALDHRRRLHPPRQGRADEGDRRRRGRACRAPCTPSWSCRASAATTCR